ncbi:MAG: nitrous-oxide reductase [Nitrospirae bacterium CG18_big_fil_WC_8_21_14_2_50_70_55]|nr:nitrous-oxide reductase [Deltaproteobacteria bacterium]OIP63558.1 MAG: nitrous-oxide reductase [Nitrospirae bacterium CG2_30_70_394]PIQ03814.1 MAG: nitrous-oxide reductase [Nitrospirae bacterium CG18_big_fil_WC_8_21_14_2_50_70_55]PIU80171.1 MAG: nitrous-oxide reductase [Nitrospirae bacterium CG06_land_8_20_14_3_00_70_43]PIW82980.1 MAG: nitrous-oxide reductase [Nitrospirae bacterium CG_4_8_14_3_um_filter_70_85]PIX82902.1 MAG: nitrous-oxide reductase [Nitrospirae bacterium CG_4_10_14_3_um_fil
MSSDWLSKGLRSWRAVVITAVTTAVAAALVVGAVSFPGLVEAKKNELRTEVPPGELDDYYGFFSGGHSGEVRVLGLPSMRLLKRIAVFNVDTGSGWGITNESKAMMGGLIVGDTHHAHASYKDGTYDGKYLFVNDKANNRLARIRLDLMETDRIIKIPHAQGTHGTFPQRYPQTDWVVLNSEFRTPVRNVGKGDMKDAATYGGVHTIVDANKMEVIAQVTVPCNLDLAATDYQGKYSFATSYNAEGGATISEMLAKDRDWLVVFNWDAIKAALKKGSYTVVDGVKMLDGKEGTGLALYIPVPKNPHGVNVSPDGKYAIASGKVSPTASVIAIDKLADAFAGKIQPKDCIVAEPEIGLGPLHTTYDGRGNAYTSLFIDSQIVKWNIQKAIDLYQHPKEGETAVVDRLDIHYQVGHTMASMSETKEADGKFLVSLNKISKDRFLNVGPLKPENDQLVDISGDKMRLLMDEPSYVEPHDCIIVRRDIVEPHVLDRAVMDEHPLAVHKNAIEHNGKKVTVHLTANAPMYGMQEVEVNEGDEVTFIVTNHDEIPDLSHGFCISEYNVNFALGPFQTKSVTFTADKPGVYWIYCTNFCHALHLEMRLRFMVKAKA